MAQISTWSTSAASAANGFWRGYASSQTVVKSGGIYSSFPDRLCKCHAPSVHNQKAILPRVAGLFTFHCPFAVLLAIALVVVDTLDRRRRVRLRAHICKETREPVPFMAHVNASAAIVSPSAVTPIATSAQHVIPRVPFWFVCRIEAARCFMQATARARIAPVQVRFPDARAIPAGAQAFGKLARKCNNNKLSNSSADQTSAFHGGLVYV